MHPLLLIPIIASFALMIPGASYSDSDFVLAGSGYGATNKGDIQVMSMQASLSIPESGQATFQSGQFLSGGDARLIKDMSLSLSNNKKSLRLSASSDDFTLSASGRLVLSAGDSLIYNLKGKTSDTKSFSIFAVLKQDKPKEVVQESQKSVQKDLLLLVKQYDRVEWKNQYKFTVRTFDPKSNTLSDFNSSSGLEGITISADVTNPLGEKIKTFSGMTQKFGYYEGSLIIPDNARTGIYILNVTASDKDYKTTSKEFTFVVIPLSTGPTATS